MRALLRAGFARIQTSSGFAVLQRTDGGRVFTVLIPENVSLYDEVIDVVLRTAGVTHSEFEVLVACEVADPIREQA